MPNFSAAARRYKPQSIARFTGDHSSSDRASIMSDRPPSPKNMINQTLALME